MISDKKALRNIAENVSRLMGGKSYSQVARDRSTKEWTAYPATIRDIEQGIHMPGAGLLARLASALDVNTDDLLADPPAVIKHRKLSKVS